MFNVTKNKVILLLIPVILIIAGIVGLMVNDGFRQDIDFAGGTSVQLLVGESLTDEQRDEVIRLYKEAAGLEVTPTVQATGAALDQIIIKSTELTEEKRDAAIAAVGGYLGLDESAVLSISSQAASYGNTMKTKTLLFSVLAALLILVYITIRFEWKSAVMAIMALVINVFVMLAVYAVFKIPLSTTFIAAILTIIGYSINDTIVIFDRIRENVKFAKKESYTSVVERSIWQSFTRTINTSVTTLITIVLLYFMGPASIKDFAFPIIVGVIVGSYTSIFVASPWWAAWKDANKASAGYAKK